MEAVNSRVTRRSNAISGHSYGENFSFSERAKHNTLFGAVGGSLLLVSIAVISVFSWLRGEGKLSSPASGFLSNFVFSLMFCTQNSYCIPGAVLQLQL